MVVIQGGYIGGFVAPDALLRPHPIEIGRKKRGFFAHRSIHMT